MKFAGFTIKRLTVDMAGIVNVLNMLPPQPADGFCRIAIATLAGNGYVNIVDGRASLSDAGKSIANAADRVLVLHEANAWYTDEPRLDV